MSIEILLIIVIILIYAFGVSYHLKDIEATKFNALLSIFWPISGLLSAFIFLFFGD